MLVVPRTCPLWSFELGSGAVPSNIPFGRVSTHWSCIHVQVKENEKAYAYKYVGQLDTFHSNTKIGISRG